MSGHGGYEALTREARAWLDQVERAVVVDRIDDALDRIDRKIQAARRRRQWIWALALLVGVAWILSMTTELAAPIACPWVTPAGVLRWGVVHVVGFWVGAALHGRRHAGAQMLVRGLWGSSLLAASLGMWTEIGALPLVMPTLVVASAIGLGLIDGERPGLDVGDDAFPLAAHRGRVVAMLILALADLETLTAAMLSQEEPEALAFAVVDGVCVVGLGVAIGGLYRLRGWGLVATLTANAAIIVLGLAGRLVYDPGFSVALAITAALQLVLGGPLLIDLLRGAPRLRRSRLRAPGWLRRAILALAIGAAAVAAWRGAQPEVLSSYCADD